MKIRTQNSPPSILMALTVASLSTTGTIHAAIIWDAVSPTSLSADTPITFTSSESDASVSDIEVDVTVSHAGDIQASTLGGGGRIVWTNDALISAGQTISFCFDFNRQLASGLSSPANRHASALFSTVLVDGTVNLSMYGGNDTLQNYFGTPTLPATTHTNANVLEYNVGAAAGNRATLNSFTSANSISLTEGTDTSQTAISLRDPILTNQDFSFSGWKFDYISDVDVPADTLFLFTFDGVEIGPAIPVPEPTGSLLALISLSTLALRRKR